MENNKYAHWINKSYWRQSSNSYDIEMHVCSYCRNEFSYDAETGIEATNFNFCPNCGSSMHGEPLNGNCTWKIFVDESEVCTAYAKEQCEEGITLEEFLKQE